MLLFIRHFSLVKAGKVTEKEALAKPQSTGAGNEFQRHLPRRRPKNHQLKS